MFTMKYGRTYHFPFSEGATNDDKIQKNWHRILDNDIVMTEKLDGENTCLKNSGIYARSHAAPTKNPWSVNMLPIWNRIKDSLGDLNIFGENLYGVHSIEYKNLKDFFYVFAIRENDKWLSWEEVKFYAEALDLLVVPEIKIGKFTEKLIKKEIADNLLLGSRLNGECEGFVFRNINSFSVTDFSTNVLKYVRKNHIKTDEHWTKNWKKARLWYEYINKE
ncbi:MAG: RNA ligase family protein [Candidatus Sericytochromatia bacterium]